MTMHAVYDTGRNLLVADLYKGAVTGGFITSKDDGGDLQSDMRRRDNPRLGVYEVSPMQAVCTASKSEFALEFSFEDGMVEVIRVSGDVAQWGAADYARL